MPCEENGGDEYPSGLKYVTGAENIPGTSKFRVHLACGHDLVCDSTAGDSIKHILYSSARGIYKKCWVCSEKQSG